MIPPARRPHYARLALFVGLFPALIVLAALSGAPRPVRAQSTVSFAVIGDYGVDDANAAAVANLVAGWSPDFVVTVGDNYYNVAGGTGTGKYDESTGKYYCAFLKDISTTGGNCPTPGGSVTVNRFFPVLGNHEYSDAGDATASIYRSYFTLPGSGFANSSGNERYYDFVNGPVHFFMVNSNSAEPDGNTATSVQAQWLQAQLAASTSPWNVVAFHHAAYSSSSNHGSNPTLQWPFHTWGADLVLQGHDHTYERILRDGIVYLVDGLGGASRYGFGTPVTGSVVRYNANWGALRVTASSSSLDLQFLSIDGGGTVQDSYTLTNAATNTPTPVPSATPFPTSTPIPATLHLGDLDGSAVWVNNGNWRASVVVAAHDAGHAALSGVLVSGTFTNGGGSASCTTNGVGQCTLSSANIKKAKTSSTFTVTGASKAGYAYQSSVNHDPDGDSSGSSIVVSRP